MARTAARERNDDGKGKTIQEFLSKPKVAIKKSQKKPQAVMEQFFRVVKPKRIIPPKNFQGFPLEECKFEEEIKEHVYCPPCWTEIRDPEYNLCTECYLRPCLTVKKWDDIMMFCGDVMVFEDHAVDGMYFKTLDHVESLMVEIFGSRYARKTGTPLCAMKVVGDYYDSVMSDRSEKQEEHPDDSLVEGALDANDYLTQQW